MVNGTATYRFEETPRSTDLAEFVPFIGVTTTSILDIEVSNGAARYRFDNGTEFTGTVVVDDDFNLRYTFGGEVIDNRGITALVSAEFSSPADSTESFSGTSTLSPDSNSDGVYDEGSVESSVFGARVRYNFDF